MRTIFHKHEANGTKLDLRWYRVGRQAVQVWTNDGTKLDIAFCNLLISLTKKQIFLPRTVLKTCIEDFILKTEGLSFIP